ncbi:MAG: hypothetical protein NT151_02115 [Acidobacteria bacterium]|nr:hypothetical protein [Acidobacteriota bacterium]
MQAVFLIITGACTLLVLQARLSAQTSDQATRQVHQGTFTVSATHVVATTPSDSDVKKPASDEKSNKDGKDAKKDAPAAKADPRVPGRYHQAEFHRPV